MKFRHNQDQTFHQLVRERVDAYFSANRISKYGNREVLFKGIFYVATTLGLYALILSDRLSGIPLLLVAILFGISSILVAFNLAHDAAHNALAPSRRFNALVYFLTFNLQGANAYLWKLRHIGSHHVFPNVEGGDADMDDNGLLRMSPRAPYRRYYRFQHLYAPFLYMLFSLHWIFVYDIQFLFKKRLANLRNIAHSSAEVACLVLAKATYLTLTVVVPIAMLSVPWWQVIVGFILMHFAVSAVFVYSLICTHFAEETAFPVVDADDRIPGSWASHQLAASLDYAPTSRMANFLLGGFNAHAAHHLFPDVCHVHYVAISKIIADTAQELGQPYNALSYPAAIRSHFRFLKRMGARPTLAFEDRRDSRPAPADSSLAQGRSRTSPANLAIRPLSPTAHPAPARSAKPIALKPSVPSAVQCLPPSTERLEPLGPTVTSVGLGAPGTNATAER